MQEYQIAIKRTARYFVSGNMDSSLKQVWFVCHGYGQLASHFLKQLEILNHESRLIIAPEGLSKFYWQAFSGRIGASWMTKENRLIEIEDYVNYLNTLYNQIFDQVKRDDVAVTVFGFSQGCATVCRWLRNGKVNTDRLILWAGGIPPELDLAENRSLFNKVKLSIVVGQQDAIANSELVKEQECRLKENQIQYQMIKFAGGHEINSQVLQDLANLNY